MIKNLNTKPITSFTQEDTIYIRDTKDDIKPLILCSFLAFEPKNRIVSGYIIEGNQTYQKKVLSARITDCALYGDETEEENRSRYRFFDRSLYAMHPLEKSKIVENDVHISEHPSYALVRFNRVSGSHRALFGSSIQSQQTVSLSISRARHDRSLSNDWFHAKQELIEIELSQHQFAELITSFGLGEGGPATIRHLNGEMYPEPPFQSKEDIFNNEFKKKMHNFSVSIKIAAEKSLELLGKKTPLGKGDRDTIERGITSMLQTIQSSIPFISEQFQESMQQVVTSAKADIEAFVENKIRNTGLEALGFGKENIPLIEDNSKK